MLSRARSRMAITFLTAGIVLTLAAGTTSRPTSAATTVSGTFAVPRPSGVTIGFAGTRDPQLLVDAQPFEVASLATFHVPSQRWSSYVPGAPTFANSLSTANLQSDSIVFVKRGTTSALTGAAIPLAGAPTIEFAHQPQRLPVPPADGLTLGLSGTTSPAAFVASQFFNTATMNVWNVQQQRYLTYIPGAPAIVNTLTSSNLKITDFAWLKALGGATGGFVLEDTPFLARLVPFGEAGTLLDVGTPLHGTLVDNGDGSVTYTPKKNFTGEDSFTYTVMTPTGREVRTFRLEVIETNDAPIANDDAVIAIDGLATVIDVLDNDVDADDDPLKIVRTTQPSGGVVAIVGDRVVYTASPDFTGVDVFEYEITDSIAEPGDPDSIAQVFVAVGGAVLAGPPPAGGAGGGGAGGGGAGGAGGGGGGGDGGGGASLFLSNDSAHLETCDASAVIDVLANDAGDGVTVLAVASVSVPTLGSASNNGDGTVTYTAPALCEGSVAFTYTVLDALAVEQSATVTITMGAASGGENQAPQAVDDTGATFQNEPVTINVLGNDSDPDDDPLTVTAVTQPAGGSVVNNGDGTVTYSANGYAGQTSFNYTISDGQGGEATASVSVTVAAAPVPPHGPVVVQSGGQVTIQVSPAGSAVVHLQSATQGSHGSTSMNVSAGTVTYQPAAGFVGHDWITWTLSFTFGGGATTTLQLKVVN